VEGMDENFLPFPAMVVGLIKVNFEKLLV
jgi:hypothetical protein